MKVRFLGTSPADNGDLGRVLPGEVYEVPKGREEAFKAAPGDWEAVSKKKSNGE